MPTYGPPISLDYNWRWIKGDDSFVDQYEGGSENLFSVVDLNDVKAWELRSNLFNHVFRIDMATGKFYQDDVEIDAGVGSGARTLVNKRRVQIRVQSGMQLPPRMQFIAGYTVGVQKRILKLTPVYVPNKTTPDSYTYEVTNTD